MKTPILAAAAMSVGLVAHGPADALTFVLDFDSALKTTYFGDNTGQPNNVTTYGCSLWDESGGEVVYHLFLPEPTMFSASITPNGCDLDLAVLDQCDENDGCLIVVTSGVEISGWA